MNSRNKQRQVKFDAQIFRERLEFGGSLSKKKAFRSARPVSTKHSMHLVLKSSKAVGAFSFGYKANPMLVSTILKMHCRKYGVKLISYSNNFNHLHMHLKFSSRALYLRFIRSITGAIAMAITNAAKSRSLKALIGTKRFFDFRPFTRVIKSWSGYRTLENYIRLNQLEAEGVIPKRPGRLKKVRPDERRHFDWNEVFLR